MTDKQPIAPTLEDLSRAKVENSQFFGYTNASGKVLSLVGLGALGSGAVSMLQSFGYMGPLLGLTIPFGAGLGVLAGSIATGLAAYWLGNFDDRHIAEHNNSASRAFYNARGNLREKIEADFMQEIAKLDYNPAHNSLPYDALGYGVMLADEKIDSLPDHIRLDIYRTQLDLDVYAHAQLTSRQAVEGQILDRNIMALATLKEQADAYKAARSRVHAAIADGTFSATRARASTQETQDADGVTLGDVAEVIADGLGEAARIAARSGGRAAGRSGGFSGGGGSFGGGGASGSYGGFGGGSSGGGGASGAWVLPVPMPSNTELGNTANGLSLGGGGSSGGGFSMHDMKMDIDEDTAKVLPVIAAVVAAVAAFVVTGFSLHKNFASKAEQPALGKVHLPLLAKALPSMQSKIGKMYKP